LITGSVINATTPRLNGESPFKLNGRKAAEPEDSSNKTHRKILIRRGNCTLITL